MDSWNHNLSLMDMTDADESKMRDALSRMLGMTCVSMTSVCEHDPSASFTISSSLWQNGRAKSHPLKRPRSKSRFCLFLVF